MIVIAGFYPKMPLCGRIFFEMMEIREAVEKSCGSLTICIIKEALFCKVYEESAWRFTTLLKPYKPICKFGKKCKWTWFRQGSPLPGCRIL